MVFITIFIILTPIGWSTRLNRLSRVLFILSFVRLFSCTHVCNFLCMSKDVIGLCAARSTVNT